MSNSTANTSQVRIIAGRWRGRKISFSTDLSIRPTPDRVRETVFNWLSPYLMKRRCLDLFAGSGVLGFESLSRGAAELVFVDSNKSIVQTLKQQHQIFKIDSEFGQTSVEYEHKDAYKYLSTVTKNFDLIFLDPPYQKKMIQPAIEILVNKKLINNEGLVYLETEKNEALPDFPTTWRIIKSKTMSHVVCNLLLVSNE
jgi:16S rRNA (guanine966-N2)-methyltransferase